MTQDKNKAMPPVTPDPHYGKHDLISRETARRIIDSPRSKEQMLTMLANMPPVQPEPKKGKWIRNDNGTWSCNKCQSWIPDEQHYYAEYCLYCGAKMK